jgi:hypothetical protein
VSKIDPFLNEPRQSENDLPLDSDDEESTTPRPKRTAAKIQVIDDGISELANTDDPDWAMSLGDNDEGESDTMDMGTMEDDTHGPDVPDSDPVKSPRNKRSSSKSSEQKKADKGKGKGGLRAAISQGRRRKQSEVRLRHSRG